MWLTDAVLISGLWGVWGSVTNQVLDSQVLWLLDAIHSWSLCGI